MHICFIRLCFLIMTGSAITATAYAFMGMLDNNPTEAAKAMGIALLLLIGAFAAHVEKP